MSDFPIENKRKADHPIHSVFTDRWSPRAFSNEAITEEWAADGAQVLVETVLALDSN